MTRAPSEGWSRAAPDGARRGHDTLQRAAGQKIAADSWIEDASLWVPSNVVNDFIFQMDAVVGYQAIAMMKSTAIKHSSQSCSGSAFNSWREVQGMKTGLDDILAGARLFGPEMHEDPYPVYRELREREPVYWDEALQAWVLTSYNEVVWALTQLSSDRVTGARGRFQDPALQPLFDILAKLMLQRDEPDYQRIRSLIQKAFLRTPVERSLAS